MSDNHLATDHPREVEYLAVVQVGGLVEDGSVISQGFFSFVDAVRWVREQVEQSHDGLAYSWNSIAPFRYDLGGEPSTVKTPITWIMTPDGPTHGYVITVDVPTEQDAPWAPHL